ncbi:MAG: histidinol-phosphatase [Gaiellaceae bacterium]|jgi:histidinol-phosphatase|nr:histidinol-phosphatase [Gaiellaceae bacterium]
MAGPDLSFALSLADLADSLSLPRFRAADLRVETKADLTPVTDADRAVERALRERIAAERPGDTVLGEEEGDEAGPRPAEGGSDLRPGGGGSAAAASSRARWILDPIDGTKNFSRGLPVWATLIALERGGAVVCGVVSAPALGHRWWAARGEGAWRDGERIAASRVGALGDAAVSCSYGADLTLFEPRVWHARGIGDFWQHVLVAEGALDAAVDAHLKVWDYSAVAVIVEEAGGRSGAPDGGAARPEEQLVSSNGPLHDDVLALLGSR